MRETITKYSAFVKEHQSFDDQYQTFFTWVVDRRNGLTQDSNGMAGDLRVLQEKRNTLEELEDQRSNESFNFDSLIELGDKLYLHTSPDGKEIIRQQIKELKSAWECLAEEIVKQTKKIDVCLQQFADFTSAQEQLTKWLKDIERHMQQHTELRATFQEKKAQLQNHKIVHQEVTSHNSLVETVCTRAQALVDQTNDKSLTVYIDSIRSLFLNIGLKSKDLMDKLEVCVADHTEYLALISGFSDFISNQSDLLSQCADVSGEKSELERKNQVLLELREKKAEGDERVAEIEEAFSKVMQSTSKRGCEKLKIGNAEIIESWKNHLAVIEDVEINIEKALAYWVQFNDDISKHHDWFKTLEGEFLDQEPCASSDEKEEKLKKFQSKREIIVGYEKTVDDFVNNSHNLLHNSGVERLKPVITQISNRYQLLHVQSKEVVCKWQGIVDDHKNYLKKLHEITACIETIEKAVDSAKKESNIEDKILVLQRVLSDQEKASPRLTSFVETGERLYPDTNSRGREVIRDDIRQVKEKWNDIIKYVNDHQKRNDAQLQHWSTYQDSLVQVTSWLDNMESKTSNISINWMNLSDVKSMLMKMKNNHQEIISHKRLLETTNEKAATVINMNPMASTEEIQEALERINERYQLTKEKCEKEIGEMERTLDVIDQYHNMKQSLQDWQKMMWDNLSIYSDYTGNKIALQSRIEKIQVMNKELQEGENLIQKFKEHAHQSLEDSKISSKVREAMERDANSAKFEFDKLTSSFEEVKHSINERLRQWADYESQLNNLTSWLGEVESNLKNFSFKASLEEKKEQFDKYQVK